MLRGLVETREGTELDVAPLLEEPAFATLGAAYEKRLRLSGGAYHSIVKRIDGFLDEPLAEALTIREERADALLKLDDAVSGAVERLKARGMTSPYLEAVRGGADQLPALREAQARCGAAGVRRHRGEADPRRGEVQRGEGQESDIRVGGPAEAEEG